MNTILLLEEKTKPAERVRRDPLRAMSYEDEATPGCTCDRWGHPCAGCVEVKPQARTTRPKFPLVKKTR